MLIKLVIYVHLWLSLAVGSVGRRETINLINYELPVTNYELGEESISSMLCVGE